MFSCPSICLFACLFVRRITQNVMDGFKRNVQGKSAMRPRITDYILGLIKHEALSHLTTSGAVFDSSSFSKSSQTVGP